MFVFRGPIRNLEQYFDEGSKKACNKLPQTRSYGSVLNNRCTQKISTSHDNVEVVHQAFLTCLKSIP